MGVNSCTANQIAEFFTSQVFLSQIKDLIRKAIELETETISGTVYMFNCTLKTIDMITVTEEAIKNSMKMGLQTAIKEVSPEEEPKIYVSTTVDISGQLPCVMPSATAETPTYEIIIRGTDKCDELYAEVNRKPITNEISLPEPGFTEQDIRLLALLLKSQSAPKPIYPEPTKTIVVKPKFRVLRKQVYVKATSTSEAKPIIVSLSNIPEGVPPELSEIAQRYYYIISEILDAVREKGVEAETASEYMILTLSKTSTRGIYYVNAYISILIEKRTIRRIKISGKEMTLSIEE